jgi:hypothetical protein
LAFSDKLEKNNLNKMTVIPFCEMAYERPIWSEKFLANGKRCGFKDLLLGKLPIPKEDESFDELLDIGKQLSKI